MKEHVKWWKIRSQECTTDFYDTEAAWRAALEWIYFEIAAEPTYSRYSITKLLQKELED